MQEEMQIMRRQVKGFEEKIDDLENRSHRANLVVKGVVEEKGHRRKVN